MTKRLIAILKYTATLLVAFVLLWFAFRNISLREMISQLGQVNFSWIYLSIALSIISHILRAYRWNILLDPLGYKISTYTSFWAVMIGYLANLAFPRMGEITKCGVIKKSNDVKISASMGTVLTERIFDVIFLFILLVISFMIEFNRLNEFFVELLSDKIPSFSSEQTFRLFLVLTCSGAVVAVIVYYLRKKILQGALLLKLKTFLLSFRDGVMSVRKIKNVNGFVLSTLGIWLMYYLMSYIIVFSIPETAHLDWAAGLAILVVGGIAMSAPVQGGIGTYHILVGSLLTLYSIENDTGIFFATLLHTSQTLSVLFFGSVGLLIITLGNRKKDQTSGT